MTPSRRSPPGATSVRADEQAIGPNRRAGEVVGRRGARGVAPSGRLRSSGMQKTTSPQRERTRFGLWLEVLELEDHPLTYDQS